MAERNLLNEGFVFNTRDNEGAISGTQTVTQQQIAGLVNGDLTTDVYTLTPGFFTALDANLGARYKINRIELYTDETQPLNFDMSISEDGIDFREVTMTGSPGLYVGDIPDSTISGAPQYIRYQHNASALRNVREWRVINDETLVDFGSDGNQTSIFIDDAPIGNPSTVPEPLELFNNYSKVADAYVFVDRTFNDAEDQLEVASSVSGPYVGRGNNTSTQPSNTAWDQGVLQNLRIVPSGTYSMDFGDGDIGGWTASNIGSITVADGFLQGTMESNGQSQFELKSEFDMSFSSNGDVLSASALHADKISFAALDVDTVKVKLKIPPQDSSVLVEGPRLFWRNQDIETNGPLFYRDELSTLSTTPVSNFNNQVQEFEFNVGNLPTWSGTIRGFAVRPFTTTSGSPTGDLVQMQRIDAVNKQAELAGGSYLTVDFRPVTSGSFSKPHSLVDATEPTDVAHAVDFRHTITQDCIISKLRWIGHSAGVGPVFSIGLARPRPTIVFPGSGSNFDVVAAVRPIYDGGTGMRHQEIDVWWSAKQGDVLAFSFSSFIGNRGVAYRTDSASTSGNAYYRTATQGVTSLATFTNMLNTNSDWIGANYNFLLEYDAVATEMNRTPILGTTYSGGYYSSGSYRTPLFDTGILGNPSCLDFDAVIPAGTSIDASGGVDLPTVLVRADNRPPLPGLGLGQIGTVTGTSSTIQNNVNFEHSFAGNTTAGDNPNQINYRNPITSTRIHGTGTGRAVALTQNLGGTLLYHREKEEYWMVNVLLSGTNPFATNDARPTWDVFDAATGEYKQTKHLTGSIFYSYSHPEGSTERDVFEPVGLMADYDRGVMYLLQRENAFFIGSNSYYGLILDLEGNFLNVYLLDGVNNAPSSNRWENARDWTLVPDLSYPPLQNTDVTGAEGIFFVVTDDVLGSSQGEILAAVARGTDSDPATGVEWISEIRFDAIPGLSFVDGTPDVMSIAYCPADGLLYCTIFSLAGESASDYNPHIFGLRPSYNSNTQQFEFSLEVPVTACESFGGPMGERQAGFGTVTDAQSFARIGARPEGVPLTVADESDQIRRRAVGAHTSLVYNESRDTFMALMNWRMLWTSDILGDSQFGRFDNLSWSLLSEGAAGTVSGTLLPRIPRIPQTSDPLYGTTSGTLSFSQLPVDSLLFPPGRYAQIEYILNANSDFTKAPKLIKSQICQGLKVGQIPAGESRTIYLRTNIPATQSIGDVTGRLKAFWELEE